MTFLGVAAALLAVAVMTQRLALARDRRRYPPPGHMIDVGGHRLHSRCLGTGGPVVLLESGIAASSLSWAEVQPRIAAFTRVCAYDRAGLAWSDTAASPRTADRIVDELATLLASVAAGERYVLVGHSFGSFLVRAYAQRHPEHVAGIVLVDPSLEWLTTTPERTRLLWGARQLSRVGAVLAQIGVVRACLALLTGGAPGAPRQFVRIFGATTARTLAHLVGEVQKLPADVHPMVQAHWCQPKCFHAMADHLLVLQRDGATLAAAAVPDDIPVVVISSGDQPMEQLAAHGRLAAAVEHGRHLVATRSAHWVQFDEPDLIVGVVRELVERERLSATLRPSAALRVDH